MNARHSARQVADFRYGAPETDDTADVLVIHAEYTQKTLVNTNASHDG